MKTEKLYDCKWGTHGLFCLVVILGLGLVFSLHAANETEKAFGGLPGKVLSNNTLGIFGEPTTGYLNPAMLTEVDQVEMTIGWSWILKTMNPMYLSLAVPLYYNATLGFSLLREGLSNIKETNEQGDETGRIFGTDETPMQIAGAYKVLPFLSVGSNLTLVPKSVGNIGNVNGSGWGLGFDIGCVLTPIDHYLLGKFDVGVNIQNAYSTFLSSFEDEADKYPLNIAYGLHWSGEYFRPFFEKVEFGYEGVVVDLLTDAASFGDTRLFAFKDSAAKHPDDRKWSDSVEIAAKDAIRKIRHLWGLHLRYYPLKFIGFRIGRNNNKDLALGVTMNWKRLEFIRHVQVDFDLGIPFESNQNVSSQMIRLAFRFGKTREEFNSEREYRILLRLPMEDFKTAMRYYLAKNYWMAAYHFGYVIAKWPHFSKCDVAVFYMGKSFEYLHMNQVARAAYKSGLEKYPVSDFRPKYIFQIQNLDYKEESHKEAIKNYGYIINQFPQSDIRPDADYVRSQIAYNQGDFSTANRILGEIAPDNENYLYAQYTLAMIAISEKKFDAAINYLLNVSNIDSMRNKSEQAVKDAANTKLGHVYFEQVKLLDARSCYLKVTSESRFYDEAMLGIVWVYIKGGVEQTLKLAIQAADRLISSVPQSRLKTETYLAKGYALTLLGNYVEAENSFQQVVSLCDAKMISESEIAEQKQNFNNNQVTFQDFQTKVYQLAMRKPTKQLTDDRDQMRPTFDKYEKNIKDFTVFLVEAKADAKLRRSVSKLREDANYAMATIRHINSRMDQKIQERRQEEMREKEEEIQKLKQMLDQK